MCVCVWRGRVEYRLWLKSLFKTIPKTVCTSFCSFMIMEINGKPLKLVNQFNKTLVAISHLLKEVAISLLNGKPLKLVDQFK